VERGWQARRVLNRLAELMCMEEQDASPAAPAPPPVRSEALPRVGPPPRPAPRPPTQRPVARPARAAPPAPSPKPAKPTIAATARADTTHDGTTANADARLPQPPNVR